MRRRDTQYLWMQEPERGFYVILCRQGTHQFPGPADDGNGASGHVPVKPGPVHDDLRRADTEYCKAGQPPDKAMEKVKAGDLNIRVHSTRTDELGRLTDSFNGMVRDLKTYLEEKVQQQKNLNETTLRLYQTQLNPHFLYNTLDTIKWNAKINQIPEIAGAGGKSGSDLKKSISKEAVHHPERGAGYHRQLYPHPEDPVQRKVPL